MCIHQQKIIVWRHPSCHLCKYFTTMRENGSRFRLLFIIAFISLCCVLGYCCTVLYRKSFRYDQSDTHTERQYHINLYLRETQRKIVDCCAVLSFAVKFFVYSTDFSPLMHSLLLFIFVSQSISTGMPQPIAPFCIYLFAFWVSKPIYSEQYCNQMSEDNESTDFTLFNSFSFSLSLPLTLSLCLHRFYVSCLILTFQNQKGSAMNRSFGDGVTIQMALT